MLLDRDARVMVTGGSGFIGTNLIDVLLERQVDVLNFDVAPPFKASHRAHWSRGDVLDDTALAEVIDGFRPQVVVHLAAEVDVTLGTRALDFETNWLGTQKLISATHRTDQSPKIVLASTQFVCRPGYIPAHDTDYSPHTAYGESKAIAEQLLRAARGEGNWFIVRPTTIWGPWDLRYRRQFYRVMDSGLYLHPAGGPTIRSFGYVGNLVAQLCGLLEQPVAMTDRRVFYLGDPCADIRQYADEYSRRLRGRDARSVPRSALAVLGRVGDATTAVGLPFPITTSRYRSMVEDYPVDLALTISLVGPGPYSLQDGVQQTLDWLHREGVVRR